MFRKPALALLGLADLALSRLLPEPEHIARERLRQIALEETHHVLHDIEWRYAQARDLLAEAVARGEGDVVPFAGRPVTAEDINDLRHRLTGYTITNNSPSAGSIAWAQLRIVYGGVDYAITDGSTANKFVWFVKPGSGSTATLQTGNTKPTLGADDLLVFINNGGVATVAASDGNQSLPTAVGNNAVDNAAIADNALTGTRVFADSGIPAGKLGTGAISLSAMFASSVVNNAAIGANAVQATQIQAGAVQPTKLNILSHVIY